MSLIKSNSYPKQKNHLKVVQAKLQINIFSHLKNSKNAFWTNLKKITQDKLFKKYDSTQFFLTYEIFNLISMYELCETLSITKHTNEYFTEEENLLFDEWSKGEFASEFQKLISKNKTVKYASEKLLPLYRDHLIATFNVHLKNQKNKNYRFNFELGDIKKGKKISSQDLSKNKVIIGKNHFFFLANDQKNKAKQLQKIKTGLENIKKYSPKSYDRFFNFTKVIVPVNRKELVSYSSQFLPGYSVVNLYHRDNIDLMDDLLHENGHHHLNTYLHEEDILNEDDEMIYYSPWRKELRHVRGIYHAFATFYWAFVLFKDLFKNIDDLPFSQKEKNKIVLRLGEEYLMLSYCIQDLQHAYMTGKITKKGLKLLSPLFLDLQKFKNEIPELLEKSSGKTQTKLINLEIHLTKKRKQYRL